MKGFRPFLLIVAALVLSGCDAFSLQNSAREDYEESRAKWESIGPNNYIAVMERQCFCGEEARGPVSVTVLDGVVVAREYTLTGDPVPAELASLFPSIDGVFDIIKDALDRKADQVTVHYERIFGIPFNFWIDYDENTADEEVGYSIEVPLTDPNEEG